MISKVVVLALAVAFVCGYPQYPSVPQVPGDRPQNPAQPPVPAVPQAPGKESVEAVKPDAPSAPDASCDNCSEQKENKAKEAEKPEAPSAPDAPKREQRESQGNQVEKPQAPAAPERPCSDCDVSCDNCNEDETSPASQESHATPEVRSYSPYGDFFPSYQTQVVPSYAPVYDYSAQYPAQYPGQYHAQYPAHAEREYQDSVDESGSYYRLDTCEYRFILDMVQCHQEEHHDHKINVHSSGHETYSQEYPYYDAGYPYSTEYPYSTRYADFYRLYGNPKHYSAQHSSSYPGYYDDSLLSYQPSVGNPFYAPGLHNQPFARYYAGFKSGQSVHKEDAEQRSYYKEGHYRSALRDFNNLKLNNVVNVTLENDASVKTSTQVRVSNEQAYAGVTPYFHYNVRLMPNHCTHPGYPGKHTCIVFDGATHPYRKVQRQFIYVTKSREIKNNYRFHYDDQHRVQYPY